MSRMLLWMCVAGTILALVALTGCNNSSSNPGALAYRVTIEQNAITATAGQVIQVLPTVTTDDGQPVSNPELAWAIDGAVGSITNTGVFTATTTVTSDAPKTGKITVTGYNQTLEIPVTVTVGAVANLEIIPPAGTNLSRVEAGTRLTFTAVATDQYGNRGATRIAVTPTWSVEGNIGQINGNGEFLATTAGAGKVVATINNVRDDVAVIVIPGALHHIAITAPQGIDVAHLTLGDTVDFGATGADAYNNGGIAVANVSWDVQGNIGTVSSTGVFTAMAIGQGKVLATAGVIHGELPVAVTQYFRGAIAFVKQSLYANLAIVAPSGAVTDLTSGQNYLTDPSFLPNGSTLAYVSETADRIGIYTCNVSGTNQRQVTGVRGQDPAWSPDGSKLAFATGVIGAGEIKVVDLQGQVLRTISVSVVGTPSSPTWSPDGSKIAFCANMGVGLLGGVYVVNADGSGSPVQVYNGAAQAVVWSPIAQELVFSDSHHLYRVAVNGGATETLVTESGTLTGRFALAPQGRAAVYAVYNAGLSQLVTTHLSTKARAVLTHLTDASAVNPSWTD